MNTELTEYEKEFFKCLMTPKYSFQDMEDHFIKKGINPFAPWMEEDHKRVQKILETK